MDATDKEGLGLSVLIYLGAVLGALALLAVPAYYLTRAEVHENPPLAKADPLLNAPMVGDRIAGRFPLANLQRQTIADAETVKLLAPKAKKAEPAPRAAQRTTARRDGGTPVAELQGERGRTSVLPFSLF